METLTDNEIHTRLEALVLRRGVKKNQLYVDFDGIKMYYEKIGNVKRNS